MKLDFLDTKRFIKKVPPSGGAPAYKLTLPHQVVHRHLLHLVEVDFELAPHNDSQQTWSGSIVPRRNKDRSEYTLQGWKLFAQAHNIQAGDQVSFTLSSPRRLVLQVLNLDIQPSVLIRKSCESEVTASPLKSSRLSFPPFPEPPSSSDPPSLSEDPMDTLFSANGCQDAVAIDEQWKCLSNSSIHLADASQEASNNQLVHGLDSILYEDHLVPDTPSTAKKPLKRFHSPVPAKSSADLPSDFPLCATHTEPGSFNNTSIFHDLVQDNTPNHFARADSPSLQRLPYNFDQNLELMPNRPPISGLTKHDSDLSSSAHLLNPDSYGFKRETGQETPRTETALQLVQKRLDEQTREALRAVLGLEQCAITLSNLHNEPGNGEEHTTHVNMFKMLDKLKGNLWRMLVLTLSDEIK